MSNKDEYWLAITERYNRGEIDKAERHRLWMAHLQSKPKAEWHGNHITISTHEERESFDRMQKAIRAESYRRATLNGDLLSLAGWLVIVVAVIVYMICKS